MILTGFTPMPMPIMIPSSGGSGGPVSFFEGLMIFLCLLYLLQFMVVWILLFIDNYESKALFFYWHIPFVPIIVLIIKKIVSIGND